MAGTNKATKFSPKVSERLSRATVIGGLTNRNYDWVDVDTVKLYSVDTFTMNDYDANGGDNRYGDPEEAQTSLQTWQLAQDRSFSGTVDALRNRQQMSVLKPGSILARQLREEVVPEVDAYVLQVIATAGAVANRDDICADSATTSSNAYSNFLLMTADINDNDGKVDGCKAVMTSGYYNMLKQSGYILDSNSGQSKLESGNLGTVDGMTIKICPSSRMPSNTDLIITHPEVTTFADVLTDYVTHTNPPGLNGVRIEGRVAYDAFVDTNKVNEVAIHKTA